MHSLCLLYVRVSVRSRCWHTTYMCQTLTAKTSTNRSRLPADGSELKSQLPCLDSSFVLHQAHLHNLLLYCIQHHRLLRSCQGHCLPKQHRVVSESRSNHPTWVFAEGARRSTGSSCYCMYCFRLVSFHSLMAILYRGDGACGKTSLLNVFTRG